MRANHRSRVRRQHSFSAVSSAIAAGRYVAELAVRAKRRARHSRRLGRAETEVRAALGRRGLAWNGERDPTPLLVPHRAARNRHYTLLGHYSYRLFLRDVVKNARGFRAADLCRYVSG